MNRKLVVAIAIVIILALCVLAVVYGQSLIEMGLRAHGMR
jgi:hypothetical protein